MTSFMVSLSHFSIYCFLSHLSFCIVGHFGFLHIYLLSFFFLFCLLLSLYVSFFILIYWLQMSQGVKREAFSLIYFKFSEQKFLLAKVTYETYVTENTWLQGWDCPEQVIMMSQRQISEDFIYRELSNIYRVGAYLILSGIYVFLKTFKASATIYNPQAPKSTYPISHIFVKSLCR